MTRKTYNILIIVMIVIILIIGFFLLFNPQNKNDSNKFDVIAPQLVFMGETGEINLKFEEFSNVGAIFAVEGDQSVNDANGSVKNGVYYSKTYLDPTTVTTTKACFAYYNKKTGVLGSCSKISSSNFGNAITSKELTDTFHFDKRWS